MLILCVILCVMAFLTSATVVWALQCRKTTKACQTKHLKVIKEAGAFFEDILKEETKHKPSCMAGKFLNTFAQAVTEDDQVIVFRVNGKSNCWRLALTGPPMPYGKFMACLELMGKQGKHMVDKEGMMTVIPPSNGSN